MKLIEKLAKAYHAEFYRSPEYVGVTEEDMQVAAWKAGFRACREMAAEIAKSYAPLEREILQSSLQPGAPEPLTVRSEVIALDIRTLGESEVPND